MFLQFCEKKNKGQSGFGDYKMLNTKETKDHSVFQIVKCIKNVGPTLWGLAIQDFAISNAKHQHTTTPELHKSERKVGPTLRGFSIRDFMNSNVKHQHIATPELQNVKGKWDQHIRVSGFGISRIQMSNANI
jgi:hypothetical protein